MTYIENDEHGLKRLISEFINSLSKFIHKNRSIKDVDSWDGSASNYDSTDDYCAACLIDVNAAAGRDTKAQSHCMLPVRGPGDSKDTFVRQAVYAAAGGHGISQVKKPDDVPPEAWDMAVKAAARALAGAYDEMEEEKPASVTDITERAISMPRLYEMVWDMLYAPDGQEFIGLVDVYDDNGSLYALANSGGKLYRLPIIINGEQVLLGAMEQVTEIHQPAQTRTLIKREASGKWRWFSVSATSVLNRSGEIDSRDLFDSFVAHAEKTGEYPIRQFYHQGAEFRTGQADFLARDGFCYITSGLFDDTPLAQAEITARAKEPNYWGESIGFIPTSLPDMVEVIESVKLPCYRQGVNIEISTLPEREAASLFTATRQMEVKRMLTGKAYEAFVKLMDGDEEKARKWLEEHPDELNRSIETNGLITRAADEITGAEAIVSESMAEPEVEVETSPPASDGLPDVSADDEPEEEDDGELELQEEAVKIVTQSVLESGVMRSMQDALQKICENLEQAAQTMAAMQAQLDAVETEVGRLQANEGKRRKQVESDMPRRVIKQTLWRPRIDRAKQQGDEPEDEDLKAIWQEEKKQKGIPDW